MASTGLASAAQQETVNPAAAGHLAFLTAPQTLTAGVASGTITVALEDAFGNLVKASSSVTASLSTTSSGGSFTPVSPLTIPAGSSSVSFHYTDDTSGTPTLTVSAGSVSSATQQENVNPAAASRVVFTTAPQTFDRGTASGTMTVALRDAFGNAVQAASPLTVNLTTTSGKGSFSPNTPVTIPAGVSTVSFQYTDDSVGTPTLTAAAGTLTSATQQETVNPAAASQLVFTTAPQTLTTGVASGTITVGLEDAFGNSVKATAATIVSLDTTSGTGTFAPVSPLTIPAGSSSVSFRYTDTSAGAPVLSASASGLSLGYAAGNRQPGPGQPSGLHDRVRRH